MLGITSTDCSFIGMQKMYVKNRNLDLYSPDLATHYRPGSGAQDAAILGCLYTAKQTLESLFNKIISKNFSLF